MIKYEVWVLALTFNTIITRESGPLTHSYDNLGR